MGRSASACIVFGWNLGDLSDDSFASSDWRSDLVRKIQTYKETDEGEWADPEDILLDLSDLASPDIPEESWDERFDRRRKAIDELGLTLELYGSEYWTGYLLTLVDSDFNNYLGDVDVVDVVHLASNIPELTEKLKAGLAHLGVTPTADPEFLVATSYG